MIAFRWIAFIPLAFAAAVLAGAAGYLFGNFFVVRYFDLGDFGEATAWIVSGIGSGLAFIFAGMKVAPLRSNKVKWTLVVILLALGAISAIGGFLIDDTPPEWADQNANFFLGYDPEGNVFGAHQRSRI